MEENKVKDVLLTDIATDTSGNENINVLGVTFDHEREKSLNKTIEATIRMPMTIKTIVISKGL